MKSENSKNNIIKPKNNFFMSILLYFLTAYIFKSCWNNSFYIMFNSLPKMTFGNAISIITFLFIISKIIGIGFGNKIEKDYEQSSNEFTEMD